MICLDKQYDKIENLALYTLTDLMQEYALEIGREIKTNSENGGRSEANLIDGLNAAHDLGYNQQQQMKHMSTNQLTLLPYKQNDLNLRQ